MEIGTLTVMCINLVCVSAAGALVLWALMYIQMREKRELRIYDEPPPKVGRALKSRMRKQEDSS